MIMEKKRRPSKRTLRKWYDMTQANYHAEVRLDIAEYFGDSICPDLSPEGYGEKFVDAFRKINEIQMEKGCLEMGLSDARELLTDYMLDNIKRVYGEDVAKSVHDCL